MYIPSSFAVTDRSALLQFLEQHSFATLVSLGADGPEATHLPLLVERQGEAFSLIGHLARANPNGNGRMERKCWRCFMGLTPTFRRRGTRQTKRFRPGTTPRCTSLASCS